MKLDTTIGKLVVLSVVFITLCAISHPVLGQEGSASASDDLYKNMYEGGLITEKEYLFALREGYLSGGGGSAPSSGGKEVQIHNKPFRKLTFEARKTRQRTSLNKLASKLRNDFREKEAVAATAPIRLHLPMREEAVDGTVSELVAINRGMPMYHVTHNLNAADTISTDEVWSGGTSGLALSGSGVTLGMWDAAAVTAGHVEFLEGGSSRVEQKDAPPGTHYHATGVAGTMIATGWVGAAKGMAYMAHLDAYDWKTNLAEMAEAIASNDLQVSNHSYGFKQGWNWEPSYSQWFWFGDISVDSNEAPSFGLYDSYAHDTDEVVYKGIYHLPVWSAGNDRTDSPGGQPFYHWALDRSSTNWVWTNLVHQADGGVDGYDSIANYAIAKNGLVIGAIYDITGGYSGTQDVVMTSFSCFGPTDDGRIKPDLVANGVSLFTPSAMAYPTVYYTNLTGTSQATPNTSGTLGLLLELHSQLHGTNCPLLASTLRALLIHTADEAGETLGPDYRFGWGLVNAPRAAQVMTNNAAWDSNPHIKEVMILDGDFVEFEVLFDGTVAGIITIAYSDPPGPEQPYQLDPTNLVLVNDLDLRVISPSGVTNMPWVLDPANPGNAATMGDNFRDNVEQVYIANPTNGYYTIRITNKGNLTNTIDDVMSQDVSIIITGNTPTNAPELVVDDYVLTTSTLHRVEWPSVVGSLYQVETLDDLVGTNNWATSSDDISATKETMSWTDNTNTADVEAVKFYRVFQIR